MHKKNVKRLLKKPLAKTIAVEIIKGPRKKKKVAE